MSNKEAIAAAIEEDAELSPAEKLALLRWNGQWSGKIDKAREIRAEAERDYNDDDLFAVDTALDACDHYEIAIAGMRAEFLRYELRLAQAEARATQLENGTTYLRLAEENKRLRAQLHRFFPIKL